MLLMAQRASQQVILFGACVLGSPMIMEMQIPAARAACESQDL